jgi:hypothetical protein
LDTGADLHADAPARDVAARAQLVGHADRLVDRDGQRDAGAGARRAEDLRVDAHDLAAHVDQRAAGVARVDRDVGLQQLQVVAGLALLGADDAGGDGALEAERRADGDHPLADLQAVDVCRS